MRKILQHAAFILVISGIVGLGANFRLVIRFLKGEFRETFLTADRYPGIRMITLLEAEDLFVARALFLDARTPDLYRDGHVLGARSLPLKDAQARIPEDILNSDRAAPVVIYCEGGDCQTSLGVAKLLHGRGFTDLRVFSGGWAEWTQAGLPEERGR